MSIIIQTMSFILLVLWWAILIRVVISWLPMAGIHIDPYNPIVKILYNLTDPILNPLRRFTTIGMIDLSPIVALGIIMILSRALELFR